MYKLPRGPVEHQWGGVWAVRSEHVQQRRRGHVYAVWREHVLWHGVHRLRRSYTKFRRPVDVQCRVSGLTRAVVGVGTRVGLTHPFLTSSYYSDPNAGLCSRCPAGQYMPTANTQWGPFSFLKFTMYHHTDGGIFNGQLRYSINGYPSDMFLVNCNSDLAYPGWRYITITTVNACTQISASFTQTGSTLARLVLDLLDSSTPYMCMPCAAGYSSQSLGATACSPCDAGSYSAAGASACTSCSSAGMTSNVGNTDCSAVCSLKPDCVVNGKYLTQVSAAFPKATQKLPPLGSSITC